MIRVFLLILVIFAISWAAIWVIENNGQLEILWLGYLVKTDILTSIILLIVSYAIFAVVFSVLSKILTFNLASIIKIFSPNKLKQLTKSLQKDERSFSTILKILQDLENGDDKQALKTHKELLKTSKNYELNDFLLAKIHFNLGDYKKSQEIARNLENSESSILILASEFELACKQEDNTKIAQLTDEIIAKSHEDSQNKSLKKAISLKIMDLANLNKYQEAKELLLRHKKLSQDPKLMELFTFTHSALAFSFFEKKSFISAIRLSGKSLKFDESYIPAQEIKIRSWLALGLVTKARSEAKKLYKKTKNQLFVTLYAKSYEGQSDEKIARQIQKFIGKKVINSNKMMNFLNKSSKKNAANDGIKTNCQDLEKDINHYQCSSCGHHFERWQPKCPSCSAINSIKI